LIPPGGNEQFSERGQQPVWLVFMPDSAKFNARDGQSYSLMSSA
jgi:hypothetical protein